MKAANAKLWKYYYFTTEYAIACERNLHIDYFDYSVDTSNAANCAFDYVLYTRKPVDQFENEHCIDSISWTRLKSPVSRQTFSFSSVTMPRSRVRKSVSRKMRRKWFYFSISYVASPMKSLCGDIIFTHPIRINAINCNIFFLYFLSTKICQHRSFRMDERNHNEIIDATRFIVVTFYYWWTFSKRTNGSPSCSK